MSVTGSNINVTPRFITAGQAIFTVSNGRVHYTYYVYQPDPTTQYPHPAHFIQVLVGPNNTEDYRYMGMLTRMDDPLGPGIKLTSKSKYQEGNLVVTVARWALQVIWQQHSGKYMVPDPFTILHIGQCGRCGRPLTTPESLATGLGPDCAAELGVEWGMRPLPPMQPVMEGTGVK